MEESHKNSHAIVKQELTLFRSVIDTIPRIIILFDKKKHVLRTYNSSIIKKIEDDLEEITRTSLSDYIRNSTSPYTTIFRGIDQIFDTVFQGEKLSRFECTIEDNDLEIVIHKIADEQITAQIHVTTKHKDVQQTVDPKIYDELHGALIAGGLASWNYDVEKKIVYSAKENSVFGKQMDFETLLLRVEPKHRSLLLDSLAQIIHHGSKFQKFTIEVYDLSNKKIWLNIYAIPYHYSPDGKVSLIIGSQKDATRKLFYENSRTALIKQNKLILNNANSGFVYMTSNYQILWENVSKIFSDPEIVNHFQVGSYCYKSFGNKKPQSCLGCLTQQAIAFRKIQYSTYTTKDGISVEMTANPVINEKGKIEGVVLRLDNITERKATYNKLKQSEEENTAVNRLLLAILECMPCTFFIKDANADYQYILANQGFCKSIGHTKKIVGKTDFEIFPPEIASHYRTQDLNVIEHNNILTTEEKIPADSKDSPTWHITKFPLIDKKSNRKLVIGVALNITERILAQQEIEYSKALLEFTFVVGKIIPWEWDLSTGLLYSSSKEALFYNKKITFDEYVEMFVHPNHKVQIKQEFDHLVHEDIEEINCKILTLRSGKYAWNHVIGQKIKDPKGGHFKILGISRIITKEVEQQQELARAKKKAEQSDALKSAFLANMSHEIRTPLNALVGFSQLMHSASTPEEQQEYQQIIDSNSEYLLNLINDILDLSKIEAGYITCNNTKFDLVDLFTELEAMIKPKLKKGVELKFTKPVEHFFICLDRLRIIQIITNFLTNAAKFTEKGSIEMGFVPMEEGVKIFVKDTGIGIKKENIGKVFDRFEKFNNFAPGTGLGMAICKAIVESYKGKIGVSSQTEKGSLFWAWLPCDAPSEAIKSNINTEIQPHTDIKKELPDITILLVEDNKDNYLLIKKILNNNNLLWVTNGVDAVHLVKSIPLDIVLMDINIPIMNGLEATKQIRQFNKDIPILATTANAFESNRLNALKAGCNDFIAKPINTDFLLERIVYWINSKNNKN